MTDAINQTRGLDRRSFLASGAVTAATVGAAATMTTVSADARTPAAAPPARMPITLEINGRKRHFDLDPRTTLLDTLRDHAGLPGSKKGCDQGQCGACTVHVDGRRTLACLTLAAAAQGTKILTIEGLGADGALHPMQQAFIDNDAFQCGYCTPGQIMSAVACVREGHVANDGEIREYMSGNLCRCAAYPNIVAAIRQAAPQMGQA